MSQPVILTLVLYRTRHDDEPVHFQGRTPEIVISNVRAYAVQQNHYNDAAGQSYVSGLSTTPRDTALGSTALMQNEDGTWDTLVMDGIHITGVNYVEFRIALETFLTGLAAHLSRIYPEPVLLDDSPRITSAEENALARNDAPPVTTEESAIARRKRKRVDADRELEEARDQDTAIDMDFG